MPTVPKLGFLSRDRAAIEERLNRLIEQAFPDWTDTSRANFGNILKSQMADAGDVINFYVDAYAVGESRWSTAVLRRSLLALVKLISYSPSTAKAASVDLTFTMPVAAADRVAIGAGRTIRTKALTGSVVVQLLADAVMEVGDLTVTATAEHSTSTTDTFLSDSRPNQSFVLSRGPFLDGTLSITAGDGTYTIQDNFNSSTASDKHATVSVDDDGIATIRTGNGINGSIPQGTLSMPYRYGGGVAGNVPKNSLTELDGAVYDDSGNPVVVVVTQPSAASGGTPRESTAQIRSNASASIQVVGGRAIATVDFEISARALGEVSRAICLTSNDDPSVEENTFLLVVIPSGGGQPSATLKATVGALFQGTAAPFKMPNTALLLVQGAAFVPINIWVGAYRSSGVTTAALKSAVTGVLSRFFQDTIKASELLADNPELANTLGITTDDGDALIRNPQVDFGYRQQDSTGSPTGQLVWSDLFNLIRDLSEVRSLDATGLLLNGANANVSVGNFGFPTLGTLTIVDKDTNVTL